MDGTGPPDVASGTPGVPRQKTAGAWAGYLVFGLFLLFLVFRAAQAVFSHAWAYFAGTTVFTLVLVIASTGGWKWLRRLLRGHQPPAGLLVSPGSGDDERRR